MLAERYGLILCGENYFSAVSDKVAEPSVQPDLCYLRDLTDFRDFVTRSPEEYERWMYSVGREAAGFEVAELISLSQQHKVIADTNIPLDLLYEMSDAQLLTPNFSLLSAKNFLLPPFSFLHKLLTPIYTMCGLLFRR